MCVYMCLVSRIHGSVCMCDGGTYVYVGVWGVCVYPGIYAICMHACMQGISPGCGVVVVFLQTDFLFKKLFDVKSRVRPSSRPVELRILSVEETIWIDGFSPHLRVLSK